MKFIDVPANLDENALNEAVAAVRQQATWCPKIGEIPHYELQTLLGIAIRTFWKAQGIASPKAPARPLPPPAKKIKGPPQMPSKRTRVLLRDKYTCYLCNTPIEKKDESIDHVIPKVKGGKNDMGNLRAAHKECNFRKGDMSLEEYRKLYPAAAAKAVA